MSGAIPALTTEQTREIDRPMSERYGIPPPQVFDHDNTSVRVSFP